VHDFHNGIMTVTGRGGRHLGNNGGGYNPKYRQYNITPGKYMPTETEQQRKHREHVERYNKLAGEYNAAYGPKSGLAGALQAVQHFIANAMDNPLAAVVGLAVGAAVLVGTLATGGGLLLALGAAGAAAFTWSFAVGAVDNVVFGGAGGKYVENTLGNSAVADIIAARNTLIVLGVVADALLALDYLFPAVYRGWGGGEGMSAEIGQYWVNFNPRSIGKAAFRRGWGIDPTWNSLENITAARAWRYAIRRRPSLGVPGDPGGGEEIFIENTKLIFFPRSYTWI
jgi:hypothetical protein